MRAKNGIIFELDHQHPTSATELHPIRPLHLTKKIQSFKFSFFLLGLFAASGLSAQSVTLDWGPVYSAGDRWIKYHFIGATDGKIYGWRHSDSNPSGFDLVIHNMAYVELETKPLIFPDTKGKELNFENTLMIQGKIYIFMSFYNSKQERNYAFGGRVDTASGRVENFQNVDEISASNKKNNGSFNFSASASGTHILVYHDAPYEKKENESFGIQVLDTGLHQVWGRKTRLYYEDSDFEISKYLLTSTLEVFLIGKYQESRKEKKDGKPAYKYLLYKLTADEPKPVKYEVQDAGQFLSNVALFETTDKQLRIAGTFSGESSGRVKGIATSGEIDFSQKFIPLRMQPLPRLSQDMNGDARRNDELKDYRIRKIFNQPDGGITVLMEQFFVRVVTHTNGGPAGAAFTSTTTYYYYSDLKVVRVLKDGTIAWETDISKMQETVDDEGILSSIASTMDDAGNICIVYNDNEDNAYRDPSDNPRYFVRLRNSGTFAAMVSPDGVLKKSLLFTFKEKGVSPIVKQALPMGDDKLLFYGYSAGKNADRLFSVQF